MEPISLKIVDNENIFCINDLIDFDVAMNSLQDKIIQIKEKNNSNRKLNCTIDFGKRMISSNELLLLFDIILNEKCIYITKINCVTQINSQIDIYNGTIRGGQYLSFENSVLINGDVNINSTIVAKNNIYIVGKSSGKLISTSKEGKISASVFKNSLIQIYDSNLELINSKDSSTLCYEDNKIILLNNSQMKGEKNVKNNCSYIR